MVTIFWLNLRNLPTPPSFVTLALRNGLEYHNAHGRINNVHDHSTLCEKLVSFSPVTPEFTRLECMQVNYWIIAHLVG